MGFKIFCGGLAILLALSVFISGAVVLQVGAILTIIGAILMIFDK